MYPLTHERILHVNLYGTRHHLIGILVILMVFTANASSENISQDIIFIIVIIV